MRLQKSDDSWIVHVKRSEFRLSPRSAPAEFALGTVNERTGRIDPWSQAFAEKRGKPIPGWMEAARLKLQEIAASPAFAAEKRRHRAEEDREGSFLVVASDGARAAFHSMPPAKQWATEHLERTHATHVEFFRRPPSGARGPLSGAPWTEPFHVLTKNQHGVIGSGLRNAWAPAPRAGHAHGDYARKPWVVYRRVLGQLISVGRYASESAARKRAKGEGLYCKHVSSLDPSAKRQLGIS